MVVMSGREGVTVFAGDQIEPPVINARPEGAVRLLEKEASGSGGRTNESLVQGLLDLVLPYIYSRQLMGGVNPRVSTGRGGGVPGRRLIAMSYSLCGGRVHALLLQKTSARSR